MEKIENIILILGSYNDEQGVLSEIATSRLDKGISIYQNYLNSKIILTGGYGSHFNSTKRPHSFYAKLHLIKNNIPVIDILDEVNSSHTLEDAFLSKKIIEKYVDKKIIIVTSDYHIPRVQFIFNLVFKEHLLQLSQQLLT